MFQNHNFILVDPNPFRIQENDKITIINDYFNDELAKTWQGNGVLFISDIRTADHRQMDRLENEQYILRDNQTQMDWVRIIKPVKSMLKFRCAYPDIISEPTKMFAGDIFIQPFAPASSTETRLIPYDELKVVEYDNLEYEEKLFYHNTVSRYKDFKQHVKGEGLTSKWDPVAEVQILGDYLETYPDSKFRQKSFYKSIASLSQLASQKMTTTGRTLTTPMKDPNLKRQFPKVNHKIFYSK